MRRVYCEVCEQAFVMMSIVKHLQRKHQMEYVGSTRARKVGGEGKEDTTIQL